MIVVNGRTSMANGREKPKPKSVLERDERPQQTLLRARRRRSPAAIRPMLLAGLRSWCAPKASAAHQNALTDTVHCLEQSSSTKANSPIGFGLAARWDP